LVESKSRDVRSNLTKTRYSVVYAWRLELHGVLTNNV